MAMAVSTFAISGCASPLSFRPNSDELALNQAVNDKQEILSAITLLKTQRPDQLSTLQLAEDQSKTHVLALEELGAAFDTNSQSASPLPPTTLSGLVAGHATTHAASALKLTNPNSMRILIQICASESVLASQLAALAI
jgi:hypothetical protein